MIITNKDVELEFCLNCNKKNPQHKETCECGNRNFIFGNDFTIINNNIVCNCNSNKFELIFRINRNPIYDKTYKCKNCNNIIGIQIYCENLF